MPSLQEELDELASPTSVAELEIANASAAAQISQVVAEHGAADSAVSHSPAPPFIDFEKVSIGFGDRKILDEVSFHVGRGQTLCILGRSGVGKSVSLRILLGFLKADSGCVRVDGQDISTLDDKGLQEIRKHVTMVFQNGALFDSLTVGENIAFPLREKGGLVEDQIQQLVTRLLDLVGASAKQSSIFSPIEPLSDRAWRMHCHCPRTRRAASKRFSTTSRLPWLIPLWDGT